MTENAMAMACGEKAFVIRQELQLALTRAIQSTTIMHALQTRPVRHEDITSTWMSDSACSEFLFCRLHTQCNTVTTPEPST